GQRRRQPRSAALLLPAWRVSGHSHPGPSFHECPRQRVRRNRRPGRSGCRHDSARSTNGAAVSVTPVGRAEAAAERVGRFRWVICALLFAATALNYVDRQIIGILQPTLAHRFHWSEVDYANIVFAFQLAYAAGYIVFGKLIDRIGARAGYALAVVIWTAAHIAHAWASSLTDFIIARFAIGLGESGNFPAGLKAVAEWFPKRERALATGIFNAGANVG